MKAINLFTIGLLFISLVGFSQVLENVDYISPENGGMIAIKKGENWGFIDMAANSIIGFRGDLVAVPHKNGTYPIFIDDRCLINKKVEGVLYYGFIDRSGATVIEPKFLYATNFKDGKAIILKKVTEKVGENRVLGKNVVSTRLEEYVINTSGKTIKYLSSRNYAPRKTGIKSEQKINSKFITKNLIGVKKSNNKWDLYKI